MNEIKALKILNVLRILAGITLAFVSLFSGGCVVILVQEELGEGQLFRSIELSGPMLILAVFTGLGAVWMFWTAKARWPERHDDVAKGGDDDERLS